MWKPPLSTNVCVPEPPHVPHLDLEAPGLSPEPEQVPQSTTVDTLIVFVVPLQASRKLTPTAASRSSPRWGPVDRDSRPPPKAPKMDSKMSACDPAPPNPWLNPPALNEPKPPPWVNAFGSKPGCCDEDPYLSNAARLSLSFNIYKQTSEQKRGNAEKALKQTSYASWISTNLSLASLSGFVSGWYLRAS